ncbi:uncharacterized protein LOC132702639 [Cylas formicarius]|uniref:uncharacterized protein LOC132702639 n=1 Tax=Cylas formicarius TaxID=197179 RepID=UPI002958DD6F|nr:uncharacterized protein LOC132702639 [Cylas formicarius]
MKTCLVWLGACAALIRADLLLRDTSEALISRQRRWLVWKPGTNWVAVIFGIGIPVDVRYQSITLGMVMKAFYQLPNNSSYYTRPSIDFVRKKRSATRWTMYGMAEEYLEANGYGSGKACVLQAICEAAAVPLDERAGLLAEIGRAFLTPSSTFDELVHHSNNEYYGAEQAGRGGGDCESLFRGCEANFVRHFSRVRNDVNYVRY